LSKRALLDTIAAEIIVCPKCPLCKSRKNAVPGDGSAHAHIVFVGEAPGYHEDIEGKPFVGDAGKLLGALLAEVPLSRKKVFITNIVKCRPPRNRAPCPLEIHACTPYLDRQISAVQPKFVVSLGSISASHTFPKAGVPFDSITKVHGKFHEASVLGLNVTLFATFHPAAALHNPKYKRLIINDFKRLKQRLKEEGMVRGKSS
jgi:uracil-DNA glycosylase family 4